MANYPSSIATWSDMVDSVDWPMAFHVNQPNNEVIAVETELGTDVAGSATDLKTRLAKSLDNAGYLDFATSTELTISGGSITPTQNWHTVDTEGDAASDDLDTIVASGVSDGFVLFFRANHASRTVVIKNGTGNITCATEKDISLVGTSRVVRLIYDATLTKWIASVMYAVSGNSTTLGTVLGALTQSKQLAFDANGNIVASASDVGGGGLPTGFLFGLNLANNGSDATNDIDIATGKCRDSTDTADLTLGSALTKRLDANWAAGTNQGMRNSGAAITNTTYHIYLVAKANGADVDVYAHASTTVATVLTALQAETGGADYIYARRIGSIIRAGGTILGFVQDGDRFTLKTPVQDVNATNPGTSAVTRTLTVPIGIRVRSLLQVYGGGTASSDLPRAIYISDLSQDDIALSAVNAFSVYVFVNATTSGLGALAEVMTNTSGQVRSRIQVSTAATSLIINTYGWIDDRGRV